MNCHGKHGKGETTESPHLTGGAPGEDRSSAVLAWLQSPSGIAACLALALTAIYLAAYHGQHVLAALPFLLLIACPLLHVLMMLGMRQGPSRHS